MSLRSEQGAVRSEQGSDAEGRQSRGQQRAGSPGKQAQGSAGALQADSPGTAVSTDELHQVWEHKL